MKRNVSLTEGQIELLMSCLQTFIQIQKLFNSNKKLTETDLQKMSQYTNLYEILAEQYYNDEKYFKKVL